MYTDRVGAQVHALAGRGRHGSFADHVQRPLDDLGRLGQDRTAA